MFIGKDEYEKWASHKFIEYASISVPWNDPKSEAKSRRLRFLATMDGRFQVHIGEDVLYFGSSLESATPAFNANN